MKSKMAGTLSGSVVHPRGLIVSSAYGKRSLVPDDPEIFQTLTRKESADNKYGTLSAAIDPKTGKRFFVQQIKAEFIEPRSRLADAIQRASEFNQPPFFSITAFDRDDGHWFAWKDVGGVVLDRIESRQPNDRKRLSWFLPILRRIAEAIIAATKAGILPSQLNLAPAQIRLISDDDRDLAELISQRVSPERWPPFSVRLMPVWLDYVLPGVLVSQSEGFADELAERVSWLEKPLLVRFAALLYSRVTRLPHSDERRPDEFKNASFAAKSRTLNGLLRDLLMGNGPYPEQDLLSWLDEFFPKVEIELDPGLGTESAPQRELGDEDQPPSDDPGEFSTEPLPPRGPATVWPYVLGVGLVIGSLPLIYNFTRSTPTPTTPGGTLTPGMPTAPRPGETPQPTATNLPLPQKIDVQKTASGIIALYLEIQNGTDPDRVTLLESARRKMNAIFSGEIEALSESSPIDAYTALAGSIKRAPLDKGDQNLLLLKMVQRPIAEAESLANEVEGLWKAVAESLAKVDPKKIPAADDRLRAAIQGVKAPSDRLQAAPDSLKAAADRLSEMPAIKRDSVVIPDSFDDEVRGKIRDSGIFERIGDSLEKAGRIRDAGANYQRAIEIGSITAPARMGYLYAVYQAEDTTRRKEYYNTGISLGDPRALAKFAIDDDMVGRSDPKRPALLKDARLKLEKIVNGDDEAKWLLGEVHAASHGSGDTANDPEVRAAVNMLKQVKDSVPAAYCSLVEIASTLSASECKLIVGETWNDPSNEVEHTNAGNLFENKRAAAKLQHQFPLTP